MQNYIPLVRTDLEGVDEALCYVDFNTVQHVTQLPMVEGEKPMVQIEFYSNPVWIIVQTTLKSLRSRGALPRQT